MKFHMENASCTKRSGSFMMVLLTRAFIIPATDANMPRERMKASKILVRTRTCKFQMTGMGKSASRKSVAMLTTESI